MAIALSQDNYWTLVQESAGLFFVSERWGDLDNSFEVPSYIRTDASLFYKDCWENPIPLWVGMKGKAGDGVQYS